MSFNIEHGLKEKYQHFAGAALRLDPSGMQTTARVPERGVQSLPMEQIQRLAGMSLGSAEEVRDMLKLAASYLPEQCWSSLIVMGKSLEDVPAIQKELSSMGLRLSDRAKVDCLASVGAALVEVPPLPGILDKVGELEPVDLLGDGDRSVQVPHPTPMAQGHEARGPVESLVRQMHHGSPIPDDWAVVLDSVRVAVLDSGIDADHPAFEGRIEEAVDFSMSGMGPLDPHGHGTHVAGIVAGIPPQKQPLLGGISQFARILDLQVADHNGRITSDRMLEAVGYAVKKGVDIMNLSFGTQELMPDGRSILSRSLGYAASQDVLPVVAAGNESERSRRGTTLISPPSDAPEAICVAAVDSNGRWVPFSCVGSTEYTQLTGKKPTVAAPGVGLISARSQYSSQQPQYENGLYIAMNGTSMAAPMISGFCALGIAYLRARGLVGTQQVSVQLLTNALIGSASDTSGEGWQKIGSGIPRLGRFLQELDHHFTSPQDTASDDQFERMLNGYQKTFSLHSAKKTSTNDNFLATSQNDNGEPDTDRAGKQAGGVGVADAANPSTGMKAASGRKKKGNDNIMKTHDTMKSLERCFIDGVQANLDEFAGALAQARFGVKGAALDDCQLDDERHRIGDLALQYGFDAADMPLNRELRATLSRGRKPVAQCFAKSFAFSYLAEGSEITGKSMLHEHVSDYLNCRMGEALDTPVIFSVFLPARWPDEIISSSLAGEKTEVLACYCEYNSNGSKWFEVAGNDYNWYTWVAMTPMSIERRRQWCVDNLSEHMQFSGDIMGLKEAVAEIGLPEQVGRQLIMAVCRSDDTPYVYRHGSEDNLHHIEKVHSR